MPRLERGENELIDRINDLVATSDLASSVQTLLELFHPMILGTCKKWSMYFNDEKHRIKPLDELIAEAQMWFIKYTTLDYKVDGAATYNKFIKDHIDQRVRYIYECELKYYRRHIFPDPDKCDPNSDMDMFESVAYNYTSCHDSMEDDIICQIDDNSRSKLAHAILAMLEDTSTFNPREKLIFTEIVYNGTTHEQMGKNLGISRTRVSQILQKIKTKLYKQMEGNQAIWDLLGDTEIEFKER